MVNKGPLKLSFGVVIAFSIAILTGHAAYGHGLGADQAAPVSFGGSKATVLTQMTPQDLTAGKVDDANMRVRFFDANTDENFDQVTYRVEVHRDGKLLLRELFFDKNGDLNIRVVPKEECAKTQEPWKCTTVTGEKEPTLGGIFARGEGRPTVRGPIFDEGGLYNIKVEIVSAISPKKLAAEALSFDTFVSVAKEQNYKIQTAQAQEVPVTLKTYYDDIKNFKFHQDNNSFTFEMPFDWSPDYVDQVQIVHEEIRVPKDFDPYEKGKKLKGYVDGVELQDRVLLFDPYSLEDKNIIHFLVTKEELKRINDKLGEPHQDKKSMEFKLLSGGSGSSENSFQMSLDNGARVKVGWDASFGAGDQIPFEFTFFDPEGKLLTNTKYGYSVLDSQGNEVVANIGDQTGDDQEQPGIMASEGIDIQRIRLDSQGLYTMKVAIFGHGIPIDQTYSGIVSSKFEIGPGGGGAPDSGVVGAKPKDDIVIPDWVRDNAGWWSEGQISDKDFASGIQYMIKNGIVRVPQTEQEGQAKADVKIPDWVRDNAGWWSEGQISDKDFASGIQYLIRIGLISV